MDCLLSGYRRDRPTPGDRHHTTNYNPADRWFQNLNWWLSSDHGRLWDGDDDGEIGSFLGYSSRWYLSLFFPFTGFVLVFAFFFRSFFFSFSLLQRILLFNRFLFLVIRLRVAFIAPAYIGPMILSGKNLSKEQMDAMNPSELHNYLLEEAASVKMPYLVLGLIILAVAAADTAVGLGLFILYYKSTTLTTIIV